MLKKEVNEVLKQSGLFVPGVFLITLLIMLGLHISGSSISFGDMFFAVYQVGLLFFSVFMGITQFTSDARSGGMEYLLTLPHSKSRLLCYKIFPRLVATIGLFVLFLLLLFIFGGGLDRSLLSPEMFILSCISLFVIGFSFSASMGNLIILFLGALLVFTDSVVVILLIYPIASTLKFGIVYSFMYSIWRGASTSAVIYFAVFGLLFAFTAAFVYAFKRFDLKPSRNFLKRYLKVFVPALIVVLVISTAWAYKTVWEPYKNYYLTSGNQLIESDVYSTRIYDTTGAKKLDPLFSIWGGIIEKDGNIYGISESFHNQETKVNRLNIKSHKVDVLYQTSISTDCSHRLKGFKDSIAFVEKKLTDKNISLVVINMDTEALKRIKIPLNNKQDIEYVTIFGAGDFGSKRYWILYTGLYSWGDIYRLWEDGSFEPLGNTISSPFYSNGILISRMEKAIVVKKLNETGVELIKTIPVDNGFMIFGGYMGFEPDLGKMPVKELYWIVFDTQSNRSKKVIRFDLETFEMKEIKSLEGTTGYFHFRYPDTWYYLDGVYYVDNEVRPVKLYRMNAGVPELVREFEPIRKEKSSEFGYRNNFVNIFDAGIIYKKDGKFTVYAFPDLKEIKFEKLK